MNAAPAGPRLLVIGASEREVCGVRSHAQVLGAALAACGVEVTTCWWERRDRGRSLEAWLADVEAAAGQLDPDWILWHYTPVTFGIRGIPALAPRVGHALRGLGAPVALVVHELAFPFERSWRRLVQAVTQRAALAFVLRAADLAFVTVERRMPRLSRFWLPRRPLVFLPVFSNLPRPVAAPPPSGLPAVGVVGFDHALQLVDEVAAAASILRARIGDLRFVLLGFPGPDSPAGQTWGRSFAAHGVEDLVSFTGVLELADLAVAIASVHVVLFADPAGPASRRGTLAAAVGAGKPVVAVDGPERWPELVDSRAVVPAEPRADGLADALEGLLRDPELRQEQGRRAAEFYERRAAPAVAAETVLRALGLQGMTRPLDPAQTRDEARV